MDEKLEKYPKTEKFRVIDTIGVPHPYCIGPKHLKHCHSMYLSPDTIREAEKHGAKCCICKGALKYDEHETALLVEVDDKRELKEVDGLNDYLLSIKGMCEGDGFVGFAFIQKKEKKDET